MDPGPRNTSMDYLDVGNVDHARPRTYKRFNCSHLVRRVKESRGPLSVDPGGVAACSRWWSALCDTTGSWRIKIEPRGFQRAGTPCRGPTTRIGYRWCRTKRSTTGYMRRPLRGQAKKHPTTKRNHKGGSGWSLRLISRLSDHIVGP